MQRVAMEIEQASSSPPSAKPEAEVPEIKKSIEVDVDDSGAGVGFATGALPPLLPLTNGTFQSPMEGVESEIHPDFVAPPSSHPRDSTPPASSNETAPRSQDEDGGVSTDVFADFDIPSDTDKEFLRAHLSEAPKEDVAFLLNTRKTPQKATPAQTNPVPSTPQSQAHDFLPGTPKSLLKYHQRRAIITEFAQKHAIDTVPGVPTAGQLAVYLEEVRTFASALGLGDNQALFEAKHAQEDLCKSKGIKLENKLATLEMPGLELTDAIEVLATVQQTVGSLFGDKGTQKDTAAAQNTTPTKRKRFRKEANTPTTDSGIGGTPVCESATTDSKPEKVMLNDRRSKRQKANIASVALEAEYARLNPGAPKLSRKERKQLLQASQSKGASAEAPSAAPATVVAAAAAPEAKLANPSPAAPRPSKQERKKAFLENKAKQAAANTPPVAPAVVVAATVASEAELVPVAPVPVVAATIASEAELAPVAPTTAVAATVASEAELAKPSPEAPKLSRKQRKMALLENKAKQASAAKGEIKPTEVSAPTPIKVGNEVATEKPSKRKRGAKNKPSPSDPASTSNAATPILPPAIKPPTVAASSAPNPVVAADDGFVDLRAPKKKKRARKSTTTTADGSNTNASDIVMADAIVQQEAAPVVAGNTGAEAESKPIVKEDSTEGPSGTDAAGKRKRKRNSQQAKKALDATEQPSTASVPVAVAAPEPMELCVDEPASKPVVAPIIPAAQPLSEIPSPNPANNKRRKRGNRKSVGDERSQDPASGGQPLDVAGQTKHISRRESRSPVTSTIQVEKGLGEWKAGSEAGVQMLGSCDEAIIGSSEDESRDDQDATTDGEAKISTYTLSIPNQADSDESREGSALDDIDTRITRSVSRERASINAIQDMASTNQPVFNDVKLRSGTPPPDDSSDDGDDLESPTRPKLVQPRRNSASLPRLTQSPNKFLLQPPEPATAVSPVKKEKAIAKPLTPIKKEKAITKSPYFSPAPPAPSPKKSPRSPGGLVSCIPFPPLSSPSFGLLQEKLCHDPLRLLIGVTFLIRTYGKSSIPIYYKLMELFPTATDLANADKDVIVELTRHLGLQSVRADTYIRYGKTFLEDPPVKGKRYRVENYPTKNAHADIKKGEVLSDEDMREGAWEIGHLTKGPYAIDSWRIFCRDELRGLAKGWNGEEAENEGFQPEWMRVLPKDKELRAFLRWCWLREGWVWDAETGEKEVAGKELVHAVNDGQVVWEWQGKDGKGDWKILGKQESSEKEEDVRIKGEAE
ncbi:hypothetical protein V497_01471 [Pseudogymnoascus sp. VKM F-4516 (FW-969)]|nr:hypothetical protein V497_01471 [Pseudogymnoascus sp. VKM F-4516 (FW-969)]